MTRALAAVFDLDGTLVDNMRFHGDAWVALAARLGSAATREDFELRWAGRTAREIFPEMLGRAVDEPEAAALEREKEAAYRAAYAPHLAPLPGLHAFLDRLDAAGVKLAIASAAPVENRDFVLGALGLAGRFGALATPGPGVRGKPHPDLFLLAARTLGVPPGRCVGFEDAVGGIVAARAAGMAAVGVRTALGDAALREAGAFTTLADFVALPAELEQALFG
ncbi:MAG: HAD family phosphatase [Candidatus Eisenbacteria bacterium]